MSTIILSGKSTNFTTYFNNAIELQPDKKYEAALVHLHTYNSIPNITTKNNIFKYSTDKGETWKILELPPDAYEYTQIEQEIQLQMTGNGDYDKENEKYYINFDICRLSSVIEITNEDYKINFDCENSIGPVLGFSAETIGLGKHKSPNIVKITDVNSILINVDFISNSYLNKMSSPTLYEFYPKVAPGYKIIEEPNNFTYLPINRKIIDSVRLWLTDQDNRPIDLQGETITVYMHIRETK